jgi:serine/threonine-protein kinase
MSDPVTRLNAALEGRYVIERELGEGGMATVYLAQDLKHERRVALKVLKPELAAVVGADRFIAEIKTTANLQHPHVLPLHDSGEAGSFLFYVMPYVEGETLRDRLNREKQLPVQEAVRIAAAVAQALDHAHRQGVIHRDIKPANVLLQDGQPVVADFGIAIAVGAAGGSRLTETGLSLGTPYYMSPEQATGDQPVGPASDIYAVGCVLYEMLVGEPPFLGNTAQAVLGKIISGAPVEPTVARRSIPPNVDAAIRRALEKIPADRFGSAQGFSDALSDPGFRHGAPAGAAAPADPGAWKRLALGLGVTTLAFAAMSMWALLRPGQPAPTMRMSVLLPQERGGINGTMALSPDGSVLIYEGAAEDQLSQLWVRRWDELDATPLPGSGFGVGPSISPDGQEVAYVVRSPPPRPIRIVSLDGGVSRTLTDSAFCCIHWASDGFIYYSDMARGLSRAPAGGGPTEVVTSSADGAPRHLYPHVIPGVGVIFTLNAPGGPGIHAFEFGSSDVRALAQGGTQPHVTASGHLVFASPQGEFLAAAFDAESLELTGPAIPTLTGVAYDAPTLQSPFAISTNGTLVYATGSASSLYQVVWVDRDGASAVVDPEWTFDPGGNNRGLALSPDGRRMAVSILGETDEDVWIKELPRGPLSRLTADTAQDVRPRWTPDGRSVTFLSERGGNADLYSKRADGTGSAQLLLDDAEQSIWEGVVSADGWIIGRTGGLLGSAGARDIVALAPGAEGAPSPLVQSAFDEKAISLSPDGRWLAYESDETGQNEIYVRPFPDTESAKWQVSSAGGVMPEWAHSGTELFYVDGQRRMVAAQIRSGSEFGVQERIALFDIGPEYLIIEQEQYTLYDVTADDQRFVMLRQVEVETPEVILVQNWFEELKERVGN